MKHKDEQERKQREIVVACKLKKEKDNEIKMKSFIDKVMSK